MKSIETSQRPLSESTRGQRNTKLLERLNSTFQSVVTSGDTSKARVVIDSILKAVKEKDIDPIVFSNSEYYIGVFYLIAGKNEDAINWLIKSQIIREESNLMDQTYSKCLYNIGLAYHNIGDFEQMEQYTHRALDVERGLYGKASPRIFRSLSSLVTANFGLNRYYEAISYGNEALSIIGSQPEIGSLELATLYENIGICYSRLSDYSKAIQYLEKSESIFVQKSLPKDAFYINLLNNIAATYYFMGLGQKSDEYFKKGFETASKSNSILSLNFINSTAISLSKAGRVNEGQKLILNSLDMAFKSFGPDSRYYTEVLRNYADYLMANRIDIKKSLDLYEQCLIYLGNHEEDIALRNAVIPGYSLVLTETGDSYKALDIIQKLLFEGITDSLNYSSLENPKIGSIEPDMWSLDVLRAKYKILWDIYKRSKEYKYLEAASETSELIVAILEKVRINISEEDSRLILGDRFRDSYLFALRDFDLCYKRTGNPAFRDKAFEYSEKSKVAGLLASTRELKATQFHIPSQIADLERKYKSEITGYNAKISLESRKKEPDSRLLTSWKEVVFNMTRKRDSLVKYIETQYPEYYLFKYNTEVVKPEEVKRLAGRNVNYLNYIVSDTLIYIFLKNRKFTQLITIPVDSGFFNTVRDFRNLLLMPSPVANARLKFIKYQETGLKIYRTILEPVRKYLISDRLLISPDNVLSYLPFETIPVAQASGEEILYGGLEYMMNDFRISYAYSATILAETFRKGHNISNRLVAFAPVYTGRINIDSLLLTRDVEPASITDLPFARQEAEYVSDIMKGKLFINNRATEASFKREAGNFDIIHLAMHTIVNDQYPMHSKMLFYQVRDSSEDGNLNTYEVYDIPLKAKMVILSSCNSGSGMLRSGEGILSLARGFIYSGSQSVVMSMWEIEDRSGTEIIKNFYRHLKRGETKSNALRKARLDYLKKADMLRSHPYFWSSLVIYGNDEPLYQHGRIFIIGVTIVLIFTLFLVYRRFR